MKARFCILSPHETNLPPMQDIQYTESGELKGGWWIDEGIEAPQPFSVVVVIDSTDAQLDLFATLPNLLYLEDIPDG